MERSIAVVVIAVVIITVVVVGIVIAVSYACANVFSSIASMKGHDNKKYFWWTFFIPLIGALMVVALPDRKAVEKALPNDVSAGAKNENDPVVVPNSVPAVSSSNDVPKANVVVPHDKKKCYACGHVQTKSNQYCEKCGEYLY